MTALVGQMLGCLLIAAGIGAVAGWLFRHRSAMSNEHQLTDRETELRIKGQALDTALYELKVKTASLLALELKISSLESLNRSTQQELASRREHIDGLQKELMAAKQRSVALDAEHKAELRRFADQDTTLAAYADEARQANAARTAAQQELLQKEQEVLDLQQRLAEADGQIVESDRLRAQVADLEPAQGRVHWLEVQLSEKEARHRHAMHELEHQLAARDRRLEILEQQGQALQERDRRIAALEQRIVDLQALQSQFAGQAKLMGEQEEEISRLRKRLVEVRAALRVRADSGHVIARSNGPANQLSLQIGQPKISNGPQKDDLKKIYGIGPVTERALNKMGMFTYIQIAKWTPDDISRIARKLETFPDRIKRDNWIASAKKQHREKYGEKL
jgi:predicted flap endonuclease-1-like 5' DNA nuclease